MTDGDLLVLLNETADAIGSALEATGEWGLAGTRPGQYRSDLAADAIAVERLTAAGCGVLSEESGVHHPDRPLFVVVDPLDGSTNASRGIPWYAASLCALDTDGPRAAVVVNLASGVRFEAVRGGGARCDGRVLQPSPSTSLEGTTIVGVSGRPPEGVGWFRALGAVALDLCAVAAGTLDGYIDASVDAHGAWDYLGGLLVCREAGAVVVDADGRDLVVRGHRDRRTPVAAGTPQLLAELLSHRKALP